MRFLVDANLPYHFSFFNAPEFIHVFDLDATWSDSTIWNYALENNLVILTKDTDFFNRSLIAKRRVKVIFFSIGSMTLKDMHMYFSKNWKEIAKAIEDNNLIIAKEERIEIVF